MRGSEGERREKRRERWGNRMRKWEYITRGKNSRERGERASSKEREGRRWERKEEG